MSQYSRVFVILAFLYLGPAASVVNAVPPQVDFAKEILGVLAQHCFQCHGPDVQEGGFRLDEWSSATSVADSGKRPIEPGNDASELLVRVRSLDSEVRMPPEGDQLSKEDIQRLSSWIASGADYGQHWAYRPLSSAKLPVVRDPSWCQTPIDNFVLANLEEHGVTPSETADRYTLMKRLYYDLLGLAPTPDTVDQFVRSSHPEAYEQLVDSLLASPHFGERWGRHWLDQARFADSDGYEKDNARPDAWHYRDWVIWATNSDLSHDRFTIDQIAGDLLPHGGDAALLATAFHRQTLTNTEGGADQEQWRVAAVMDRTETLGTVWLGLTIGCARCHNHKYDQISQDEYYQLFAFFNNGDETESELHTIANGRSKIRVLTERTSEHRVTRLLERGDFLRPKNEVTATTLATLPALGVSSPSANRLDLAKWLVDGRNPLPARVAVNQIWLRLFRFGLVRTADDFGVRGEPPTHPALLDWLAAEFIRNGWSRKSLLRTIVLSSTYQQSSQHRDSLRDLDPANRWLHRQNRFRVEAETVRDLALSASGLLTRTIGGPSVFPPIPPSITELSYNGGFQWQASEGADRFRRGMYTFFKRTAPHPNLTTFDCPNSNVTSVVRETSNTPIAALVTLNNLVYTEASRGMANSLLASRSPHSTDVEVIKSLWRRCVARPPTDLEIKAVLRLLNQSRAYYRSHLPQATELVGSSSRLLGGETCGETASEVAAWVATARIVMNLDEFLTRE